MIRDCFSFRSLHDLPPPSDQELLNVLDLPPGTFRDKFEGFRKEVFASLSSKKIGDVECDGEQLADFLETCVEALNKDEGIDVPNVRDIVVERYCRRTMEQLEKKYSDDISVASVHNFPYSLLVLLYF